MHRFFVLPSSIAGDEVTITGPQAHQIAHVLRMRPGATVVVLDNSGWEIDTQLTVVESGRVTGKVVRRRLCSAEPHTKISLYQAVLKSQQFEVTLQKCTELGIVEFIPLVSERCIIQDLEAVEHKRHRWEGIIQEAAEQCRRGRKPALRSAVFFPQACEQARCSAGLSLIPWEEPGLRNLQAVVRNAPVGHERGWPPLTVSLFIGPEGGFTSDEIALAGRYNLVPVTLGPRILRAETAGIVAAAAILYELGDLN
jgi:16S rRNA (uracil1498-N3)-methyltransferase